MDADLEGITYGVEIECMLPYGTSRSMLAGVLVDAGVDAIAGLYGHSTASRWRLITDGSLMDYDRGCELVSPILSGDEGFEQIRKVCMVLADSGCTVDRRCGLHVHVGASGRDVDFFKNLVKIYARYETVIDGLVAPSRRGDSNSFCHATKYTLNAHHARTVNELRYAYGVNRYRKLNLESYWRHGTVEFRQHQGTIDADKITAWATLCLRMVDTASKPKGAAVPVAADAPVKPVVTSATNVRYQAHFDRLAAMAEDGDWNTVSGYHDTGVNSYAKMVRKYRDALLAWRDARASEPVDLDKFMELVGAASAEKVFFAARAAALANTDRRVRT